MHISEIGLCSGHSTSGVWVNERGETTLPGLYAAGDMALCPTHYLLGALVYGIKRPNPSRRRGWASPLPKQPSEGPVNTSPRWPSRKMRG